MTTMTPDQYELDLKLGEAYAEIKKLRKRLADKNEELSELRRTMASIHAVSNQSFFKSRSQGTDEADSADGEKPIYRPLA